MTDISGFGTTVVLIASNTFPNGITLTQFADDADSFDSPSVSLGDVAMGMNGTLATWSHAVPVPITINMMPNTEDDENLKILASNNRVATGKLGANDIIQINVVYPDGKSTVFSGGKLTGAPGANSVSAAGRLKTNAYAFMFQKVVGG